MVPMPFDSAMAGIMVVSRRASLDVPAPGGPSRRRFGSQRLHDLQLHHSLLEACGHHS
jgi:hypothetical protein